MNPSNYIHYQNGRAVVKYEHPTLTSTGKQNYGTGTTIFWQSYDTGWGAVLALTEYCNNNGLTVQVLDEKWRRYYEDMDAHEKRCIREKPLLPEHNTDENMKAYSKAESAWRMMCSCDAPNKPGYYRANND